MKHLVSYFGKVLGGRILAVLVAFVALLVLMDMIDNIEGILEQRGSLADILLFVGYRLPTIIERLIPLSVLIGSVMGILVLVNRSELIVLRAAGVSPLGIAALGLPACLMIMAVHFALSGYLAPYSQNAFVEWWDPLRSTDTPQWLRGEDDLVRIGAISQDGRTLSELSFFTRDEAGRLIARLTADTAQFEDSGWRLEDVSEAVLDTTGPVITPMTTKLWPDGPDPDIILDLIALPEQLTKNTLGNVLSVSWNAAADPSLYRTELARRSVAPLTSLVMMLIAASTIRGQSRSGAPQIGAAIAVGLGLTFLVVDGIFVSLGKAGAIAPAVAAWTPLLLFATISCFFLFRAET